MLHTNMRPKSKQKPQQPSVLLTTDSLGLRGSLTKEDARSVCIITLQPFSTIRKGAVRIGWDLARLVPGTATVRVTELKSVELEPVYQIIRAPWWRLRV